MRKALILVAMAILSLSARGQSDLPDLIIGAPTGLSTQTGSVRFSPANPNISGSALICLYPSTASSCGVGWPDGVEIFYTLDGTPATPASTWYKAPHTQTTGYIVIPDPGVTRTVTINAIAVQMKCTSTACMVHPTYTPACSVAKPCYGVIVQDGQAVKNNLKTVVACTSGQCPASNFTTMPKYPNIDFGSATSNNGCRGVPTNATFSVGNSQPCADLYTDTNSSTKWTQSTAGSTAAGGGSIGDTEILEPYDALGNVAPYNVDGCPQCTGFTISRLVAHDYEGTTTNSLNAANLADLEQDDNQWNWELGATQSACTNKTSACYGSFNVRCAPYDVTTTVGTTKYSGLQHNGQDGGWKNNWPSSTPNHACTMPFGTITALADTTSCGLTFTPGNVAYNGQKSWGLDLRSYLLVDQGTANAESIFITGLSGNTVTSCVRGAGGTTPHTHSAGALASDTVLIQVDATHGPSAATGTRNCTSGPPEAPDAYYYNYVMANGYFYGTSQAEVLLTPSAINVQQVWPMQTFSGKQYSSLCDYYSTQTPYEYPEGRFNDQLQLYTKLGSGVNGKAAIFWMHDNTTAHFGATGPASQANYTQTP